MIWTPHVTVAAVAERDGRFLMVEEESDGEVVFNQPAGHLDRGESLIQAVVREALEETAWDFRPEAVVGIYLWTHPARSVSYLRVAFCGDCVGQQAARPLDRGILRAVWLSRQELAQAHARLRSPMVLRTVDDYLAGRRYPLCLLSHLDGHRTR
jgi:8-oxo-dGTP pyrophosphatase MutT (NUDIX family)